MFHCITSNMKEKSSGLYILPLFDLYMIVFVRAHHLRSEGVRHLLWCCTWRSTCRSSRSPWGRLLPPRRWAVSGKNAQINSKSSTVLTNSRNLVLGKWYASSLMFDVHAHFLDFFTKTWVFDTLDVFVASACRCWWMVTRMLNRMVNLCRDSRWASRSASLQICGIPRRAVTMSWRGFVIECTECMPALSLSLSLSVSVDPSEKNAFKIFLSPTVCALSQYFQIDDSCLVFFHMHRWTWTCITSEWDSSQADDWKRMKTIHIERWWHHIHMLCLFSQKNTLGVCGSAQEMTDSRRKLIYEDVLEVMQLSETLKSLAQFLHWPCECCVMPCILRQYPKLHCGWFGEAWHFRRRVPKSERFVTFVTGNGFRFCLFVVFFCGCVTDAFIVAFFFCFFLSILRNLISGKVSIKTMDISVAHSLHGSERCAMLTHSSILLCWFMNGTPLAC